MLRRLPWGFSAHAKDIWLTPEWEKREKIISADFGITCTNFGAQHLRQIVGNENKIALGYHGLDLAWFTEHHFVDDGYLPSWIPVAGAMAARTKRIRFNTDICLLPFNHPVRLAEDLAVLDNLSNGRIELGCGMGYAPHEFRGFGLPVALSNPSKT